MYKTKNLQLNQYERTDYFNIDYYNENNQKLDTEIADLISFKEAAYANIVNLGQQIEEMTQTLADINNQIQEINATLSGINV